MSPRVFTDYGLFVSFFEQYSPNVVVLGASYEEDRFFIGELLFKGNFLLLHGESLTKERFLSETENYGLFSGKRNILIYKTDTFQPGVEELICFYLKNPNPYVFLIVFVSKKPHYELLFKTAEQSIFVNLFGERAHERDRRVLLFLQNFLQKQGMTASREVVKEFMMLRSGMDKLSLFKEFEKLLCLLGKKTMLVKEDLKLLGENSSGINLWELRDWILKRNLEKAFSIWHSLFEEGREDPLGVTGFLRTQMLFGLRLLNEDRYDDKKAVLFAGYGVPSLKRALVLLFYAEDNLKKGSRLASVVMESLIFRLINESMVTT